MKHGPGCKCCNLFKCEDCDPDEEAPSEVPEIYEVTFPTFSDGNDCDECDSLLSGQTFELDLNTPPVYRKHNGCTWTYVFTDDDCPNVWSFSEDCACDGDPNDSIKAPALVIQTHMDGSDVYLALYFFHLAPNPFGGQDADADIAWISPSALNQVPLTSNAYQCFNDFASAVTFSSTLPASLVAISNEALSSCRRGVGASLNGVNPDVTAL